MEKWITFSRTDLKTSLRVEIVVDFFYNIVVRPNLKRIWEFVEPLGRSKFSSSLFGLAYGRSCFRFVESISILYL